MHRTNAFETGSWPVEGSLYMATPHEYKAWQVNRAWQVTGSLYNSTMGTVAGNDVDMNTLHHAWDSISYWDTERYGEAPLIGRGADTDEDEWSSAS